jgi:hypothetical protein
MLKYADLTKAQKRFVDAVLETDPSIKKRHGIVSRKELESLYWTMAETRAAGGEKIGFPNWLTAKNRVGRGEFQLPMPEGVAKKAKKADAEDKAKFEAIVAENTVNVADVIDSYDADDSYDAELEDIRAAAYDIANS